MLTGWRRRQRQRQHTASHRGPRWFSAAAAAAVERSNAISRHEYGKAMMWKLANSQSLFISYDNLLTCLYVRECVYVCVCECVV